MGYGATRTLERVAAAMGELESATIQFSAAHDIPQGGVLLAVPALLAMGLLRPSAELYSLPHGYYGLSSILLLLAMMALARLKSIEQLRYLAPGEWGNLVGLDRIPEVRTLRAKLELLCQQAGRAVQWNTALAKEWMGLGPAAEPIFYVDGHVRVYQGQAAQLPRHYVPRQKLYLRASVDYWINAMDGQPFVYINQEIDHGLVQALREDVIPWVEAHAAVSAEQQRRMEADPLQPRFTVVFDREGYSPTCLRSCNSGASRCSVIIAIRVANGRRQNSRSTPWSWSTGNECRCNWPSERYACPRVWRFGRCENSAQMASKSPC